MNQKLQTSTEVQQSQVETVIKSLLSSPPKDLHDSLHISYLLENIQKDQSFHAIGLDVSHPWMIYWILSSLSTMKYPITTDIHDSVIKALSNCMDSFTGAFHGGGDCLFPNMPHLLTTFAAIHSICILGTPESFSLICKSKLLLFLESMYMANGCFRVHALDGEYDLRACYAALCIATLCDCITSSSIIDWTRTVEFVASCQNYDGGFGNLPNRESHGGYTFCAVATLSLLNSLSLPFVDLDMLKHWIVHRQMSLEGGFQGRTNKLVDGCYSYWIGSIFGMLDTNQHLWNPEALVQFLLQCCQCPSGGMLDKPNKYPDFYHTCYDLGGLSIALHTINNSIELDKPHAFFLLPQDKVANMISK